MSEPERTIVKGGAMSRVTRLHDAVKRGDLETMTSLLDDEPGLSNSVSETDPRLTYPLHLAAEFDQMEAARTLIARGADVSLVDGENDATALGWAAFYGRPGLVDLLLKSGADPNQRNKHGLTPLD